MCFRGDSADGGSKITDDGRVSLFIGPINRNGTQRFFDYKQLDTHVEEIITSHLKDAFYFAALKDDMNADLRQAVEDQM